MSKYLRQFSFPTTIVQGAVALICLLYPVLVNAQVLQLNVNGSATTENQRIESLSPTLFQLSLPPVAGSYPVGNYEWIKNEQTVVSTNITYYVDEPGVYRLRFNSNQLSNCVIINWGRGTENYNYSILDKAVSPGINASINLDKSYGFEKTVTYQDGFGRPMERIAVNATAGTNKDLIQPYTYGPQGEETMSYLPFALGQNGQYKENWQGDQFSFYDWVSPKVGRPGGGHTYSEVKTDEDPLQRIKETASPGKDWGINDGHTKQFVKRSNTDDDGVFLWTYIPAPGYGTVGDLDFSVQAPANTLAVTITKDEDDNWTVQFTDEKSHLVCQRTYTRGNPQDALANTEYLETNYAYNVAGQLLAVIPPKATKQLLDGSATPVPGFLEQYLFITQYDELGRSVAKKVPGGKEWAYTVYDRWDRVAATQDPNQRERAFWSFAKYDALNRVVITGEIQDGSDPDALSQLLTAWPGDQRYEKRDNNMTGYTLNQTWPDNAQDNDVAVVHYYDDYDYSPLNQRTDLAFVPELGNATKSTQTRGMRTGGRQRTLSATDYSQWITSIVYYDQYGRAIQTLADNFTTSRSGAPAVDRSTSQLAFSGEVSETLLTHHRYNAAYALETHTTDIINDYDAQGRLSYVYESIDNAPFVNIQGLEYNELGQVVDKKLGFDNANNSFVQSLDYRYNIRGWLTNINNRNLSNNEWLDNSTPNSDTEPQDAFGLEIKYESGGTTPGCYNGNISAAVWNSAGGRMRQYGYTYDQANRITAGNYSALDYVGGNYVWTAEKDDSRREGNYTTNGILYDENGNITALKRTGVLTRNSAGSPTYGRIDELAMDHDGNRLLTVTDGVLNSAATNDFENGSPTGALYKYDKNGNLTRDPNKKVWIYYNQLNLPWLFFFENGDEIFISYTSTGEKINAEYWTSTAAGNVHRSEEYINGFTYSSSTQSGSTQEALTVATPTGRAIFEAAATPSLPAAWGHEYHIRDHQGSLRLVLKQEPVLQYRATMETANAVQEEDLFKRVAESRQLDASHARTGMYSARLNAHQIDRSNGPATEITVSAGDSVHVEVYGLYDKGKSIPSFEKTVVPVLAIGSSLVPNSSTQPDNKGHSHRSWVPTITAGIAVTWDRLRGVWHNRRELPQASLTYELYSKDSTLITRETFPMSETSQPEWQRLHHGFRAKEAGYVKVYVANASEENAWFDDLTLNRFPALKQQENHYDPFGQNLEEIELTSGHDSKYQYTGKERVADSGLEWTDFGARWYDSQLGRWHSVDPASQYSSPYTAMGNNPIANIDPDGRFAFIPILSSLLQSAGYAMVFDAAIQSNRGGKFNWGELIGTGVGAMATAGMSMASNRFLLRNGLAVKYGGKAVYAGLAATTGSLVGQVTESLINDGNIGDMSSHLKDAIPAAGIAVGISLATSAYDYITWDRFDGQTKVDMINEEFNSNITFNSGDGYGSTDLKGNVEMRGKSLENKAIARNTAAHELSHRYDRLNIFPGFSGGYPGLEPFTSAIDGETYDSYQRFTEFRAHGLDMQMTSRQFLPTRYYNESRWVLTNYYGFKPFNYAPLTPFNILANLLR